MRVVPAILTLTVCLAAPSTSEACNPGGCNTLLAVSSPVPNVLFANTVDLGFNRFAFVATNRNFFFTPFFDPLIVANRGSFAFAFAGRSGGSSAFVIRDVGGDVRVAGAKEVKFKKNGKIIVKK